MYVQARQIACQASGWLACAQLVAPIAMKGPEMVSLQCLESCAPHRPAPLTGVLSGEKQRIERNYNFTEIAQWFAAR
jgi:hypothetical protein